MASWEEADAKRYCIENGLIPDPYVWSSWIKQPLTLKIHRSVAGGLLFGKNIYCRYRMIKGIDRKWEYQYATKKEAFLHSLGDKE